MVAHHHESVLVNDYGPFCRTVDQRLEQGYAGGILGFLVKFHVEHKFRELAETVWMTGTKLLC